MRNMDSELRDVLNGIILLLSVITGHILTRYLIAGEGRTSPIQRDHWVPLFTSAIVFAVAYSLRYLDQLPKEF